MFDSPFSPLIYMITYLRMGPRSFREIWQEEEDPIEVFIRYIYFSVSLFGFTSRNILGMYLTSGTLYVLLVFFPKKVGGVGILGKEKKKDGSDGIRLMKRV